MVHDEEEKQKDRGDADKINLETFYPVNMQYMWWKRTYSHLNGCDKQHNDLENSNQYMTSLREPGKLDQQTSDEVAGSLNE
jgi:hypothetical protein